MSNVYILKMYDAEAAQYFNFAVFRSRSDAEECAAMYGSEHQIEQFHLVDY